MNKLIYMVIEANPDGDRYQMHSDLQEAKESFNKEKQNSFVFSDSTFYLVGVQEKADFGFSSKGGFYGGEVIEEFSREQ